jgi:hypothetical protein
VLVLLSTSRYGIGVSPDSTVYLSTARNLLVGHGYRSFTGHLYTQSPPLFPTLLAVIGLVGVDPAVGARFLNAFAFGGIVCASGMFFSQCLRSKVLAVVGTLSVMLSYALLAVSGMAWTEPVFVLLIVLFILQIVDFRRRRRMRSLVAASLCAAFCLLERYAGVALIVPAAVLILAPLSHTSLRTRLGQLGAFLAISCVPLAAYCIRNYLHTGMLTGHPRLHSIYALRENVVVAADTATRWLVPPSVPLPGRTIILAALICLASALLLLSRRKSAAGGGLACMCAWPVGLVLLTYVPLILYTHQVGVLDEIMNDRYLAPVAVLILWFLFVGIDRSMTLLAFVPCNRVLLRPLVIGMCVLWLILYPLGRARETVRAMMRDGAGGYSTAGWKESPLVRWLGDHSLDGPVRSNMPDALYALTGISAQMSPVRSEEIVPSRPTRTSAREEYLVWFGGLPTKHLCSLEELISQLHIEEMARFADGGVYRLPPSAEGAYPDSRIFSRYMVNGIWRRTFRSEEPNAYGTISCWLLQTDGTTESVWRLNAADGRVIRWQPSCRYTRLDETFELHCEGEALEETGQTTSAYVLDVRGTVEGDRAVGTYRIEFADPQWPSAINGPWRVDLGHPVRRLYCPRRGVHFYTMSVREAIERIRQSPGLWRDEGVVFHVYEPLGRPPDTRPVYQFRSRDGDAQFFTILEAEKDRLINGDSHAWDYRGVAFYAYEEGSAPPDAQPVHRFWSPISHSHFYTTSEDEKRKLAADPSRRWLYEGIAWYTLVESPP